ncbi:hypothetical protein Slin15195_G055830 [Septoria linicola]|uniref:Uncharacterized protein n=1 Tax=Septoria linicola TaxID=215465 RepID=A0A9Q9AMY7_9PEZI|nr:hypothetical protein Slin14017_G071700 [Septoria linicola]USW52264.1 hypothetical protein Slin15195_G055830 [Septoria linicola]
MFAPLIVLFGLNACIGVAQDILQNGEDNAAMFHMIMTSSDRRQVNRHGTDGQCMNIGPFIYGGIEVDVTAGINASSCYNLKDLEITEDTNAVDSVLTINSRSRYNVSALYSEVGFSAGVRANGSA